MEEKNIKDLKDIIMNLDPETLNNLIKNSNGFRKLKTSVG